MDSKAFADRILTIEKGIALMRAYLNRLKAGEMLTEDVSDRMKEFSNYSEELLKMQPYLSHLEPHQTQTFRATLSDFKTVLCDLLHHSHDICERLAQKSQKTKQHMASAKAYTKAAGAAGHNKIV